MESLGRAIRLEVTDYFSFVLKRAGEDDRHDSRFFLFLALDMGTCWAFSPSGDSSSSITFAWGTRIVVPQPRQRTILPRAPIGTASMRRQVSFGHIIWMTDFPDND